MNSTRHIIPLFLGAVLLLAWPAALFASAPPAGKGRTMIAHHHGVAFAGIGVDNPPDITGLQLGLHCMARNLAGVQLGIGSSARSARGLQFSLASSMTADRLAGVQFALAISDAEQGMDGLQLSFFRSSTGHRIQKDKHGNRIESKSVTRSRGLQFAICGAYAENLDGIQLVLWDAHAQDLDGLQVGVMHTAERFSGVQAGILNVAGVEGKSATGLQIGLFNTTDDFTGLQLGLLNRAKQLKGLQIGLINICESARVKILPLINASF